MARRRFRNQRSDLVTDRAYQEFVLSTETQQLSRLELVRLLRGGEDTYLELKVKLSNSEKIAQGICALANTGGGIIVFGVTDQLRIEGLPELEAVEDELVRICRDDIVPQLTPYFDAVAFDNGRRVLALEVRGTRRPYRTRDGRCYIRIGAEKREASFEELSALVDDARSVTYENMAAIGANLRDIDDAHLWSFVRPFEADIAANVAASDYPTGDVLERDLLLATTVGLMQVPTVAGLLLFGRDERVAELLPRSNVIVTRFSGDTLQSPIIEEAKIKGNLLTIYEEVLRFIERYCDLWDVPRPPRTNGDNLMSDAPIVARANYHRASVCEGIVNALAHRDLVLREHPTRVHIFDRSLEIINARRTANFSQVAGRAIRYGIPQRLNPQLLAVLTNPAYGLRCSMKSDAARQQSSLPLILRESRLFSGNRAEVHLFNDEFRLRLHGA